MEYTSKCVRHFYQIRMFKIIPYERARPLEYKKPD